MQTRHVTLEDAANVLIGEEEEGQTKYKSKKLTTLSTVLFRNPLLELKD